MSSESNGTRRFKPQLVEESTASSPRKHRRFSPDPISTITRSSHKTSAEQPELAAAEGHNSNPAEEESQQEPSQLRRKFAVEPVEVSNRSSRNQAQEDTVGNLDSPKQESNGVGEQDSHTTPKPRRRFAPQLVATATRRRRSTDEGPALSASGRTDSSLEERPLKSKAPSLNPYPPANTPVPTGYEGAHLKPQPTRQGSMKPHNNTRLNTRQHSFKVPMLSDIDSSESGESNTQSLSPRQDGDSDTSDEAHSKNKRRMQASDDGDVSGYLLAMAAKTAEKQLREQEAAAFVNTDFHDPVAHYMNKSDSDDENSLKTVKPTRKAGKGREDSGDEKAELRRLQKHAQRINHDKQDQRTAREDGAVEPSKRNEVSGMGGFAPISLADQTPRQYIGGYQKDPDLMRMRKAASPPMLGANIGFPRCASPDFARFDVTQGADYLRRNMCYLSEQVEGQQGQEGLWNQRPDDADLKSRPSTTGGRNTPNAETQGKKGTQGDKGTRGAKGLWGGFCNAKNGTETTTPTGLMTPRRTPIGTPAATPVNEREDYFGTTLSVTMESNAPAPPRQPAVNPPTPPETELQKQRPNIQQSIASAVDSRLRIEAQLDAEFHDTFVTQVYNYLSFGYPALARKFDEELSRVAKVGIEELREDDKLAEARGYVRLGNDEVDGAVRGLDETSCKRWIALKKYVREWGRQMLIVESEQDGPWGMQGYGPHRAWGISTARRGSWGN